ncbi:TCTEX1D1 [Bugula neritina]|uniref:TCTEX1D1 n=1 Tax=Bugula neritina TaxID=10212 RepID=A0A7J7JKL4_BUGNE|nr:TCTEX1D1 [Bugula neritina]
MPQNSFYIQTGKKVTDMPDSPEMPSSSTPLSARTVKYSQTHQQGVNSEPRSDSNCKTASILKRPKQATAPSAMSMTTWDADIPRLPVSRPPTYQLGPAKERTFPHIEVKKLIETILKRELLQETYDHERSQQQMTSLTEKILCAVKRMPMDRYKLVCSVLICQKLGQSLRTVSRCAWDEKVDSYTSVVFENKSLHAVATVYGLYAE